MEKGIGTFGRLASGILAGFILFFFCYWWTGAITLSIVVGLIVVGGVILVKKFQWKQGKEESK